MSTSTRNLHETPATVLPIMVEEAVVLTSVPRRLGFVVVEALASTSVVVESFFLENAAWWQAFGASTAVRWGGGGKLCLCF